MPQRGHQKWREHNNNCRCPKWISDPGKLKSDPRYPLGTNSWPDALTRGQQTLRGYDPEIAAARKLERLREQSKMSIKDACDLYLDKAARERGKIKGTYRQYASCMRRFQRWTKSEGIDAIGDVTTIQLTRWYGSIAWLKHKRNDARPKAIRF